MIRDRDTFLAFMQNFLDKLKDFICDKFATKSFVEDAINEIDISEEMDLSSYAKKTEIINSINTHNYSGESHIDIRNSISALQGAFIYRGRIGETTQTLRNHPNYLDSRINQIFYPERVAPFLGDVLVDNNNVEWYYNGESWDEYGQGEIGLASNSSNGLMSKEHWTKLNNTPTSFAPINAQKNIQSDWNITDDTNDGYIKNKPNIPVIPSNVSSFNNDSKYLTESNVENLFFKTPVKKSISADWTFDKGNLSNIIPIVYRGAPPESEDKYRESGIVLGRNNVNYSRWVLKAFTEYNYGDGPNFCIQKRGTSKIINAMFFKGDYNDRIGIFNDNPQATLDVGGNIISNDLVLKNKYTLSQKIIELENKVDVLSMACSDEKTSLEVSANVLTFRMPYKMILNTIKASVNTAPTGAKLIIDIKKNGSSILSTLLSIDNTEKTSKTASVPLVISNNTLNDDDEITIAITQVGSTIEGEGLKVYFIGKQQNE